MSRCLVFLCALACVALGPVAELVAEPAPSRVVASPLGDGYEPEALTAWVEARKARARDGVREVVRIPVAFRSLGWGCDCPAAYLGTDPDVHEGGPWLDVELANSVIALPYPEFDDDYATKASGGVMLLEGYFTGTTHVEDLRGEDGEPAEWRYPVEEFVATGGRPFREDLVTAGPDGAPDSGTDSIRTDFLAEVLLEERSDTPWPQAFDDDRSWLVIAGSVRQNGADAEDTATALFEKLVANGFSAAEWFDSRRAPALACCFLAVVAGRFADKAEAKALARKVEKSGVKVFVKRGWE